jgi:hypothetical protein
MRALVSHSRGWIGLVVALFLVGCETEQSNTVRACTLKLVLGLTIKVSDASTRIPLSEVTITATEQSTGEVEQLESDPTLPGTYRGLPEKHGHYTISVSRENYSPATIDSHLAHDGCHVIPQSHSVSLTPL